MTPEVRALMQRFNAPVGVVRSGAPRQRCRKCRGYLWITGKKVHAIDGLYCTFECSTWTQEQITAFDAWQRERDRHCGCSGSSGRKTMYESKQEAIENIPIPRVLRVYPCPQQRGIFHLTKKAKKCA